MRKKMVSKSLYALIYRSPSKSNTKPLLHTNANREQKSCSNSVECTHIRKDLLGEVSFQEVEKHKWTETEPVNCKRVWQSGYPA